MPPSQRVRWLRATVACLLGLFVGPAEAVSAPAAPPVRVPFLTLGPYYISGSSVNTWSQRVLLGQRNSTCNRFYTAEFKWSATSADAGFDFELDYVEIGTVVPETGEAHWNSASASGGMNGRSALIISVPSTQPYRCTTQLRLRGWPNFTWPQLGAFYVRFYD